MAAASKPAPENTAVRVALWRALHALTDPPPHVFDDHARAAGAAPFDAVRKDVKRTCHGDVDLLIGFGGGA
ncbi:hypothetical protein BH09MYX1_BH09MYX1_02200 [soil metagenome]